MDTKKNLNKITVFMEEGEGLHLHLIWVEEVVGDLKIYFQVFSVGVEVNKDILSNNKDKEEEVGIFLEEVIFLVVVAVIRGTNNINNISSREMYLRIVGYFN
jgi:hypothetical protein